MSGYIGNIPVPQATQTRQSFTATAGQTTFATIGYTPSFLDVFMNGVHLLNGTDFTATNGSDVVLTTGAAAGDIIEVIAYSTYQVNDQAFTGDFSVDTDTLYVDSTNNRVGVGTATPDNTLHVVESPSTGTVKLGQDYAGVIQQWNNNLNIVANGDQAYRVGLGTNDGTGNIVFQTAAYTTGNTERMRITDIGNVGINTSTPNTKLEIKGELLGGNAGDSQELFRLFGPDATNTTVFKFLNYRHTAGSSHSSSEHRLQRRVDATDQGYVGLRDQAVTFGYGGSEKMRLNGSGQLFLGATGGVPAKLVVLSAQSGNYGDRQVYLEDNQAYGQPAIGFHAPQNATAGIFKWWGAGAFFECRDSTDTAFTAIGASAFNVSSDYRLKENIVPLNGAADRLASLPVHRFNFIEDIMGHGEGVAVDGFLAHEVAAVVPEAVTGEKDAVRDEEYEVTPAVLDDDGNVITEAVMGTRQVPVYQSIDQSKLVPLLTAALQEALGRIETLEADVAALKGAS